MSTNNIKESRKQHYDVVRILIYLAGIAGGVICYFIFPRFGKATPELQSTIATVFSIFGGFQMAIFAALSALNKTSFRTIYARRAAARSVSNRFKRQCVLFYIYVLIIMIIVVDQAFHFYSYEELVDRIYVSLSVGALVWSLELPRALISIHEDGNSSETPEA